MFNRIVLIGILFLPELALCQPVPGYITALEGAPVATTSPADYPGDWLMAHVDVETTGLVPGYHEMIDIGIIMADLEGREIDRLFLRVMPDHPERAAPGAVAVNGFSPALWAKRGFVSSAEAVDTIRAFHHRTAGDKNVLFTGYNAWFDISFIDHLFRSRDSS